MPDVRIHLPAPLRPLADGAAFIDVRADTVDEALACLSETHKLVHGRVFGDDGEVRSHVNVFLDGRELRTLAADERNTVEGSEISIIPSIAGG